MPIIEVNLIPPQTDPEVLKKLCLDLFQAVAGVQELHLTDRDTSVLLRPDILDWGIGSELIVFVDGLFQKPERTQEVIDRLLAVIGECILAFAREHVPQCTKVEVIPRVFDQANGFWSATLAGLHPLDEEPE